MILLNKKIDYAMLILCYLHHAPAGGAARAIANRFGLSRAFVANILKDLCHKGFVTSHRGVKGGYFLKTPAANVSLADLLDALEDPVSLVECINRNNPDRCCTLSEYCPIRDPIAEVHQRLREVLEKATLADIFGKSNPQLGPAGQVQIPGLRNNASTVAAEERAHGSTSCVSG